MPDGHEAIARIRDLRAHEILDVLSPALFKDWEEITILEREDLDALIQTNTRISEATRAALHDLAAMLDNQLIWCTIREASVIIVGLNKEYYLQSLQVDASTTGLLLCNSRGTVIASNIQLANEKERQDFEENASQYTIKDYKTDDVQTYELYIRNTPGEYAIYLYALAFGVAGVLLAIGVSWLLSRFVEQPINRLTQKFSGKTIEESVKPSRLSIRSRIALVMFISVFIPTVVLNCVLYSVFYSKISSSDRMLADIQTNMVVQTLCTSVGLCEQNKAESMDTILTAVEQGQNFYTSPESGDFFAYYNDFIKYIRYLTLSDAEGNVLYQSRYFNEYKFNQQFIRGLVTKFKQQERRYALYSFREDPYGDNGIVLIDTAKSTRGEDGYLLAFFDSSLLESYKKIGKNIEYIVTDENQQILYDSGYFFDNEEASAELLGSASTDSVRISGTDYQICRADVEIEGLWKVYVFRQMHDVNQFVGHFRLLIVCSLVGASIVILLLSYYLSLRITKGFERLKKSMQHSASDLIYETVKYTGGDEIGGLIQAYNDMIQKIEVLNAEKAQNQMRVHALETLKIRAELQSLQSQVNPHFLFNTLSIISGEAARIKNEKITTVITAITKILRYGLKCEAEVTVGEELDNAEEYVKIQKTRFDDRVKVIMKVDPVLKEHRILKQILEPLVENAFSHGVYECVEGGLVAISIQQDADYMDIRIRDNGIGMSADALSRLRAYMMMEEEPSRAANRLFIKGNGTGLRNVYHRVIKYYDGNAEMGIDSARLKGTTVWIRIRKACTVPVAHEKTAVEDEKKL